MPELTLVEQAISRMLADPRTSQRKKGLLRRILAEIEEVRKLDREEAAAGD